MNPVTLIRKALDTLALAAAFLVFYPAMALVTWYGRKPHPQLEVPPAPERPTLPPAFKPVKPRAVKDRLAWRKVHPREAEAIARHARQLHYHDREEAELRHG